MSDQVKAYLAEIGRRGGQKSKRKLTKAQARAMVRARTAKRAALRPNNCSTSFTTETTVTERIAK